MIALGVSYDVLGSVALVPLIPLIGGVFLVSVLKRETDPVVRRIIGVAFVLKVAAAVMRYLVAFELYDAVADAAVYDEWGARIARQLWAGDLTPELGWAFVGTGFIRLLTGVVYAVIGPTKVAAYLIFACIGFAGSYLFYRAFRSAVPQGAHRLYAGLVFLAPSMLFWPAGIGKEAWLTLALGVLALGVSRFAGARSGALLLMVLGLAGTVVGRPHLGVLAIAAVAGATLFARARQWLLTPRPLAHRLGPVVVVAVGAVVGVTQLGTIFDRLGVEGIRGLLDFVELQTVKGGSGFAAPNVLANPLNFPWAVVTVVGRPFVFEANNALALFTALESTAILLLVAWRVRSMVASLRLAMKNYYVMAALIYVLGFIVAFSAIGNFAILARQRTLFYPFLFVLVCASAVGQRESNPREPRGRNTARPAHLESSA